MLLELSKTSGQLKQLKSFIKICFSKEPKKTYRIGKYDLQYLSRGDQLVCGICYLGHTKGVLQDRRLLEIHQTFPVHGSTGKQRLRISGYPIF